MPSSLYGKLMAALLALLCVVGAGFIWLMQFSLREYQDAVSQEVNRGVANELMRDLGPDHDPQALKRRIESLMHIHPGLEIYLLDREGEILAFSAHPGKVMRRRVDLDKVKAFVNGEARYPMRGADPRDLSREKIFSAAALGAPADPGGYVYAILGGERYEQAAGRRQASYVVGQSVTFLVLGLAAALLFGWLMIGLVTRKLKRLAGAMDAFSQGEFGSKILFEPLPPRNAGDEIDRVAATYNEMVEQITEQMRELHRQDSVRRDLIANVSHDLRTPLASLRGYLETLMIKGETLSVDERRVYLGTAVQQAERLSQLVAELFELAKLEASDAKIHAEPFALAELIQDVGQKFELEARRRSVTLDVRAREDLPFVQGDIGLIERVLQNLIDNALRHTPAGGRVAVRAAAGPGTVTVSVRDTGPGIPQNQLALVFERFYRLDKSRDSRSGGAGLGLAIARRIVELHHGRIAADSAPGRGAEFTFSLPARASTAAAAPWVDSP